MLTDISKDSVKQTSRTPSDVQKIQQEWYVLVKKVIYSVKQPAMTQLPKVLQYEIQTEEIVSADTYEQAKELYRLKFKNFRVRNFKVFQGFDH